MGAFSQIPLWSCKHPGGELPPCRAVTRPCRPSSRLPRCLSSARGEWGAGRGLQGCAGPLCGETARQGFLCPVVTVLGGCCQYEQPP